MAQKVKIVTQPTLQPGTTNTYYVRWKKATALQTDHTDHFEVAWCYHMPKSGAWFREENTSVGGSLNYSTYNPPENANIIKVYIKPVATQTKPVRKKQSDGSYQTEYQSWYTGDWRESSQVTITNLGTPSTPSVPTVTINGTKVVMEVNNITDPYTTHIIFQAVKNQERDKAGKNIKTTGDTTVAISEGWKRAKYTFENFLSVGDVVQVRCRAYNNKAKTYSGWSEYTDLYRTPPAKPKIISYRINSANLIRLDWNNLGTKSVKEYVVEYALGPTYFDASSQVQSQTVDSSVSYAVLNLDTEEEQQTGRTWWFRVKAVGWDDVSGDWSHNYHQMPWKDSYGYKIVVGLKPSAPTTWSSATSVKAGDTLYLYWVHNATDGTTERGAEINVKVTGAQSYETTYTVTRTESEDITIDSYLLDTSSFTVGAVITWKVRTKGILDEYGEWSTARKITVYGRVSVVIGATLTENQYYFSGAELYRQEEAPTLQTIPTTYFYQHLVCGENIICDVDLVSGVNKYDEHENAIVYASETDSYYQFQKISGEYIWVLLEQSQIEELADSDTALTGFPLNITAAAGPSSQTAIGWNIDITAQRGYERTDTDGNIEYVSEGQNVFSKYVNSDGTNQLNLTLNAGDVDLETGVKYRIKVLVAMNSGLTGEDTTDFEVMWEEESLPEPDAAITYDAETASCYITPFCQNEDGTYLSGVTLSVYRREYDGRMVKIASDIDNTGNQVVEDPHPSLDVARYRIVAFSSISGTVAHYDLPAYPVNEKAIIIQWNEDWLDYNDEHDRIIDDDGEVTVRGGSLLRLPYNVDTSESRSVDNTLVEYIGRSHPVSYYGTQLGVTDSWSTAIPRTDVETLHALRRLAIYLGDVYVREPSGVGYWANVKVSLSQTHKEVIIPVSLSITRVDGGI